MKEISASAQANMFWNLSAENCFFWLDHWHDQGLMINHRQGTINPKEKLEDNCLNFTWHLNILNTKITSSMTTTIF